MVGRAAARTFARHGSSIEVWNYQKDGEDDYGENYSKITPVETTQARVVPGDVDSTRDAYGADVQGDAAIYCSTAVTITREGGGDGATRLDTDGDRSAEYVVVLDITYPEAGYRKLVCERRA